MTGASPMIESASIKAQVSRNFFIGNLLSSIGSGQIAGKFTTYHHCSLRYSWRPGDTPMTLLLVCLLFFVPTQTNKPEATVKASVCQLKTDPNAYEHKLVEVTGFVMTGGREDF